MDKKGMSIWMLPGIVVLLVVIAIILGVGSDVTQDIRDDNTAGSYAYNATDAGLQGISEVADWQDNIGKIIGVVVILGLIMGTLGYMAMRR